MNSAMKRSVLIPFNEENLFFAERILISDQIIPCSLQAKRKSHELSFPGFAMQYWHANMPF